jgi:hypothetical protein
MDRAIVLGATVWSSNAEVVSDVSLASLAVACGRRSTSGQAGRRSTARRNRMRQSDRIDSRNAGAHRSRQPLCRGDGGNSAAGASNLARLA